MKLTEGVYENLISDALRDDIREADTDQALVSRLSDIDKAEATGMISDYIARLIVRRLSDEELTEEEKFDFANDLIDKIAPGEGDRIVDKRRMLTAMISRQREKALQLADMPLIRPQAGFRVSYLFTGGQGPVALGTEIERDIASADRVSLIVSFLKLAGVNLIYDALSAFCNQAGHTLRIITTTYCGITEARAVERLAQLPNTEIRVSYNTAIERLHAKAYIFERNSGMDTAYIGSSNLSKSAQTDGLEWNIRVTNVENPHIIRTALATFERYWDSPNFEDYRDGGLTRFIEQTGQARISPAGEATRLTAFTLLPHQKQLLDRLAAVRQQGITRNLIVAATGTGKTVVSAFDYRAFALAHPTARRLLFVAHREEILKQSLATYRSVLVDANFGQLWVGGNRPADPAGSLFVSVQTLRSHLDYFSTLPADYYDYIVIDEAHHSAADSYRPIFGHFTRPQLLIGLTATPERMDGHSLLPDFDHMISAEMRLPQALDEGLLTPFQYLCISDPTDLTDDSLMQGLRYVPARMVPRLCRRERVDLIVDRLRYYLPDEQAVRALCFCATKEHADYMATELKREGLRAESLTSDNTGERERLRKALATGQINYLCVVDIFNEGVDIPEIDTVLFLRPTESLTIFLQQLGRGLRLAPGKQLLTVMDFVSQYNNHYDYASRFRALMTRTDKPMAREVREGFTLLPRGCSIHMEEVAQRYVLQSIRQAVYRLPRLVREIVAAGPAATLEGFVESHDIDLELIYTQRRCWTMLRRAAGFVDYADDDTTRRLTKGLGSLIHTGSLAYLRFIRRVARQGSVLDAEKLNADEQTYALMLYYALFQEPITKVGVASIYEALARLSGYPHFTAELGELATYLMKRLDAVTQPVGMGLPETLEVHGCYTREEVFIIMGRQTAERRMQGNVAGVFAFNECNTEAFFVTLNKADRYFSPTTRYEDFVISERRFHWQSQNRDAHENRQGQRFIRQRETGRKFLLFVREDKHDGYGNTCPFHCFGLVDYVSSHGDRPMNIVWQVEQPVMPRYLKSV